MNFSSGPSGSAMFRPCLRALRSASVREAAQSVRSAEAESCAVLPGPGMEAREGGRTSTRVGGGWEYRSLRLGSEAGEGVPPCPSSPAASASVAAGLSDRRLRCGAGRGRRAGIFRRRGEGAERGARSGKRDGGRPPITKKN